jgi:cytochrome c biogenesis protein
VEKEKGNAFANKIWDLFTSIKLAIIIFPIISLTSIIGTIVEQQADPGKNIKLLTGLFGASAAPTVYNVFTEFGFIDMYRSWWYIALLSLLALNIIVCSVHRLPGVLKIIKASVNPLSNEQIEKMTIKRSVLLKGKPEKARNIVSAALKKAGFSIKEVSDEKGFRFCSWKGGWSRFGVYITHLSIIVIMLGALTGMIFSQESYISLPEGDISSVTYPIPDSGRTEPFPLGFLIRNDNFEVTFYGKTEKPKLFKSNVAILENGKEVLRKSVTVNDPLTYRGTTFYLSDYGVSPRRLRRGIFIFSVTTRDGRSAEVRLSPGDTLEIPGTSITGTVINFSPALKHEEDGKLSTYTDKLHNPAVHMDFKDSGKKLYSSWILKRYPETSFLPDGNRVEFIDYWGVEYAFFRIRKDPGEWLIYPGLIAMGIGLVIALFMSHKKVWVNLVEEGMNTRVIIGAAANRYRSSLEEKVEGMTRALSRTEHERN